MRHKFFKRSTEKFDCRIDPEVKEETTSTSGSESYYTTAGNKLDVILFWKSRSL